MPELPEVESVRRYLAKALENRTLVRIEPLFPGVFSVPKAGNSPQLPSRFEEVGRKGKMLALRFEQDQVLLVHLRMTGRLYFPESRKCLVPHTHVLFHFRDGSLLAYSDPRRFGRLIWHVGNAPDDLPELRAMGPDALDLALKDFLPLLGSRNRMIKPLLLDQSVLAGLGNIYVDETLFLAGIHPKQLCANLSKEKLTRLWEAIDQVLKQAIEVGGSTIRDFVGSSGETGGYQDRHSVYGRGGLECVKCGGTLRRILVSQRGTTYCPGCQPLRSRRKKRRCLNR